MSERDIDKVTRHLEAVLAKERREAMTYTVATVLCTPAFVVLGALFAAFVAVYIISHSPGRIELGTLTFYTAVNVFWAYMVAGDMTENQDRMSQGTGNGGPESLSIDSVAFAGSWGPAPKPPAFVAFGQ